MVRYRKLPLPHAGSSTLILLSRSKNRLEFADGILPLRLTLCSLIEGPPERYRSLDRGVHSSSARPLL